MSYIRRDIEAPRDPATWPDLVPLPVPAFQVEQVEALTRELAYFVECIAKDETPFNDGAAGLRVVKMLEAANTSISKRGELVYL